RFGGLAARAKASLARGRRRAPSARAVCARLTGRGARGVLERPSDRDLRQEPPPFPRVLGELRGVRGDGAIRGAGRALGRAGRAGEGADPAPVSDPVLLRLHAAAVPPAAAAALAPPGQRGDRAPGALLRL